MTYDAIYKDFVAKAATRVFAQMVGCSLDKHEFNIFGVWNDHSDKIHHIAYQAAKAAFALADKLEGAWQTRLSHEDSVPFFDPADAPMISIEESLADIAVKMEELKDCVS